MTRHEIRETAFIILYQLEACERPVREIAEADEEAFDIAVNAQACALAEKVWENRAQSDEIIGKYSLSRAVGRISKVNLAILRIAIYEMNFAENVPPKAAINEAIELSKAYAEEKDRKFINGLLNSFYKDMGK